MNIHWIDPVNSDAQFLNLLSHSLLENGNRVIVRSNKRQIFRIPEGVEWYNFSLLGQLPQSLDGHPVRYAVGLAYPTDWMRCVGWLIKRKVKSILLSGNLKLAPIDSAAHYALKKAGIETVNICHKPHPDFYVSHSPELAEKYKNYYHYFSKIITMTDYTRELMMDYYDLPEDKFVHMPHPHFKGLLSKTRADERFLKKLKTWAENNPVITITSNYTPEHGFNQFFKSLPFIRKKFSRVKLLVVSVVNSRIKSLIKNEIEQAGFGEKDYFLHTRPYSYRELLAILETSSLVLTPYNWATQSGVIPLASGFGKPVVATDVGGLKEMVIPGKSGEVVQADDPEGMASACFEILAKDKYQDYVKGSLFAREELFSTTKASKVVTGTLAQFG